MRAVYESLEVVITLRCNGRCRNCIRLCNRPDFGLDYSDMDMAWSDVSTVIEDLRRVSEVTGRPAVETLCFTGGEPLLHELLPSFVRAAVDALEEPGIVEGVVVNSNRTLPIPAEIEKRVVHWWSLREKAQMHQCALVSPSDPPDGFPRQGGRTWEGCQHFRRNRIVVTRHGYQLCCAAEGYTRLMGLGELYVPRLPETLAGFPRPDAVCDHCAFGAPVAFPEAAYGCPVSPVFLREAEKNRAGRRIGRRLGG